MGIPIQSVQLFYREGSSDKVYNVTLEAYGNGYRVHFQYGRRGAGLLDGDKITDVPFDKAEKVYDKLVSEKVAKGYTDDPSGKPGTYSGTVQALPSKKEKVVMKEPVQDDGVIRVMPRRIHLDITPTVIIPQLLNSITEEQVPTYLNDDAWGGQEKHDGKHLTLTIKGGVITARNKKGKECGYPTAYDDAFINDMVIDGEQVGNKFIAYDLLEFDGIDQRQFTYKERHRRLTFIVFKGEVAQVSRLAIGFAEKSGMLCDLKAKKKEGMVFKLLSGTFKAGRPASGGDMLKFKFYATASVIVAKGREGKHSIGMELINKGGRVFVGNCTIPVNKEMPKIGSVIEVRMLYCFKGGCLYQPTYIGSRDDINIEECTTKQLKYKPDPED